MIVIIIKKVKTIAIFKRTTVTKPKATIKATMTTTITTATTTTSTTTKNLVFFELK